ncbi:methyltransferase domain-containing protein [Rhizobium sp. SG2393]|uniref:class I SAM-dependent DNA methyltransferase n=1 Tax=Rhizobium sp. SG2393 TaxID=3276279 RepID=UPI00366B6FA5
MSTHQLSSGDLLADRRADYARMMAEGADFAGAAELMEQALEIVPGWAAGWFRLGEYREKAGLVSEAVAAYRAALDRVPEDIFGASLKIALLSGEADRRQAPSAYVGRLFDDYAERFDTALVEKLGYSVPQSLTSLLLATTGNRHFARAVDLGCGTGLLGAELRAHVDHLEGYDLSAGMLAKAEGKGLYDRLGEADLSLAPEACGVFAAGCGEGRADLAAAADVLMYLGALDPVFTIVTRLIGPGGLFAFSVEDAGADGDVVLRPSLRFAHSQTYVSGLVEKAGLTLLAAEKTTLRKDGAETVPGILFIAQQ